MMLLFAMRQNDVYKSISSCAEARWAGHPVAHDVVVHGDAVLATGAASEVGRCLGGAVHCVQGHLRRLGRSRAVPVSEHLQLARAADPDRQEARNIVACASIPAGTRPLACTG